MTLPELIEKIEGASGPDRELDVEIHTAATSFEPRVGGVGWPHGALVVPAFPGWKMLPHYTESLDAAMSLCPQGSRPIEILHEAIDRCGSAAQLFGADRDAVFLKRLPQFVTAACLRARVEKEG